MRHFWTAKTGTDFPYYAVGVGDREVVLIKGESETQSQQWALICARALNANEAEMHRAAEKDDE